MKNFAMSLLVVVGLNGVIQARKDEQDKWDTAIEQSNLASVKKLLRRFEGQEATADQKKKTLKELVNLANDGVDTLAKVSVFADRWDLSKFAGGAVLGGCGLACVWKYLPIFDEGEGSFLKSGGGLALAVAGFYLAFKGYRCTAQQDKLKNAKKIEALLEDALASLDRPVGPDLQKVTK